MYTCSDKKFPSSNFCFFALVVLTRFAKVMAYSWASSTDLNFLFLNISWSTTSITSMWYWVSVDCRFFREAEDSTPLIRKSKPSISTAGSWRLAVDAEKPTETRHVKQADLLWHIQKRYTILINRTVSNPISVEPIVSIKIQIARTQALLDFTRKLNKIRPSGSDYDRNGNLRNRKRTKKLHNHDIGASHWFVRAAVSLPVFGLGFLRLWLSKEKKKCAQEINDNKKKKGKEKWRSRTPDDAMLHNLHHSGHLVFPHTFSRLAKRHD